MQNNDNDNMLGIIIVVVICSIMHNNDNMLGIIIVVVIFRIIIIMIICLAY